MISKRLYLTLLALSIGNVSFPLSLKTHREFYESLLTVMKVDPSSEVSNEYLTVRPILSQTGDFNDLSSPLQIGLLRLSGIVCLSRIKLDEAEAIPEKRWMHKKFNFGLSPKEVSATMWRSTVQEYARLLWQRDSRGEDLTPFTDWLISASRTRDGGPEQSLILLGNVCAFMATSPTFFVR